jgi:hypothetical protein
MSLTPENSSAGWPRFGEHFKIRRDSNRRWMKVQRQVITMKWLIENMRGLGGHSLLWRRTFSSGSGVDYDE